MNLRSFEREKRGSEMRGKRKKGGVFDKEEVCVILQEKLSKTVNMRAMNMLGKAEERVREWGE